MTLRTLLMTLIVLAGFVSREVALDCTCVSYLVCYLFTAARQLCWPLAILFYRCRLDLSFLRHLISVVAWPIVTKLCHMFDSDLGL